MTFQKKILLVEDTPSLADEIVDLLAIENYTVTLADNGAHALQSLEYFTPDLIITDLVMPELDGFDLIRTLRADHRFRHIPVLVITAKTGEEVDKEAIRIGAHSVLKKPCKASTLMGAVHNLVKE